MVLLRFSRGDNPLILLERFCFDDYGGLLGVSVLADCYC